MTMLKLSENLEVIDLDSSSKTPIGHFVRVEGGNYIFKKIPFTSKLTCQQEEQVCWLSYNLRP